MGRARRRAAAVAAATGTPTALGLKVSLNMQAVARFLWAADARKVETTKAVFEARLVELGAPEKPDAVLPCPEGLVDSPNFNQRALFNFAAVATLEEAPVLQAILATVRKRLG